MEEILPGIHHWTAFHEGIRERVHSYYVEPAGALIDPMVPEDDGLDAFKSLPTPQQALMSSRHHTRHCARFREAFGVEIRASAPGMPDLEGLEVTPFRFGDEVAPGITAVAVEVLAPDETCFHITHGPGALSFGDALVRPAGVLAFQPDELLGPDPLKVKKGLKNRFRAFLERDFDALLFAHGEPLPDDGKTALRKFVELPTEYPEYGPLA